MRRKIAILLSIIQILGMSLITGCWDRRELTDLVIVYGWGIDSSRDDKIEVSAQCVTPSKLGGGKGDNAGGTTGNNYFVVSGTGNNTLDAIQEMQTKISRHIFRGQIKVIVIGEELARCGVKDIFDNYVRDQELRLRTDLIVIKGGTAKDFLKVSAPLENIPSIAVFKVHQVIGGTRDNALRDFLIAATSGGISANISTMEFDPNSFSSDEKQGEESNKESFRMAGTAIFNKDLKLVGFLNMEEDRDLQWVLGNLEETIITVGPQEIGNFSFDATNLSSKIKTIIEGKRIKLDVTLTGQGSIKENSTKIDLSQPKNLNLINDILNQETAHHILKTIKKVQEEFGTDVFGFGEAIHREYPYQWEKLKENWEKQFQEAEVSVKVNLTIQRMGMTGPPLELKEDEINK